MDGAGRRAGHRRVADRLRERSVGRAMVAGAWNCVGPVDSAVGRNGMDAAVGSRCGNRRRMVVGAPQAADREIAGHDPDRIQHSDQCDRAGAADAGHRQGACRIGPDAAAGFRQYLGDQRGG
ncbi:hypothetical protein CEE86_13360, partial [Lactobacillus crispatus]